MFVVDQDGGVSRRHQQPAECGRGAQHLRRGREAGDLREDAPD